MARLSLPLVFAAVALSASAHTIFQVRCMNIFSVPVLIVLLSRKCTSTVSIKAISLAYVCRIMTVSVSGHVWDLSLANNHQFKAHYGCHLQRRDLQRRYQPIPPAYVDGCHQSARWSPGHSRVASHSRGCRPKRQRRPRRPKPQGTRHLLPVSHISECSTTTTLIQ